MDSLEYEESSPLQLFLISNGLVEYTDKFMAEKIDLESLLILTDEDLISLGLPLGPRRKLMAAVQNRKKALEEPGEVLDSQLWPKNLEIHKSYQKHVASNIHNGEPISNGNEDVATNPYFTCDMNVVLSSGSHILTTILFARNNIANHNR